MKFFGLCLALCAILLMTVDADAGLFGNRGGLFGFGLVGQRYAACSSGGGYSACSSGYGGGYMACSPGSGFNGYSACSSGYSGYSACGGSGFTAPVYSSCSGYSVPTYAAPESCYAPSRAVIPTETRRVEPKGEVTIQYVSTSSRTPALDDSRIADAAPE